MKMRWWNFVALTGCLLLLTTWWPGSPRQAVAGEAPAGEEAAKILLIAGPCQHPPGTHEAAAGVRLLEYCVENAEGVQPVRGEVFYDWPKDTRILDDAATIVFIGDIFPPERMDEPAKIKAKLASLMDRGCGLVCIHYATGLRAEHVAENGDHPLLGWLGGYFATGCPHHRSVARVLTSTVAPEKGDHPVLRGWKTFTFDDEPYWNNYFGEGGPAENVTPLAYSMLPPNEPKKEVVAWAVHREDGGRGMGIVLPHYFRSWSVDDLRTLVLNGICWTAKLDIPAEGVQVSLPDLTKFEPGSVDPRPRPKKRQ
jgi:type 1 glutamine amidotransferase